MTKEERVTVSQGLEWDDWARILGRDPATLDVDEIITADMAMGEHRRRLTLASLSKIDSEAR